METALWGDAEEVPEEVPEENGTKMAPSEDGQEDDLR